MSTLQIELTDTQFKAFEYVAKSPQEWVENFAKERARQAVDDIIAKLIEHCNSDGIALAVGRDAQIDQAFSLGIVTALKDVPEPTFEDLIDPATLEEQPTGE
jgi:hypothetical protein